MENSLYAIINPSTNKIVQFSQLENLEHKIVLDVQYVNGERIENSTNALCVLVNWTPDLADKTYDPNNNTFV